MSTGSPKLARREQAIEATRRRLRRLEIEAHRIKAELARLEAEYEDDVADWLSRKVRRRAPPSAVAGVIEPGSPATLTLDYEPARGRANGAARKHDLAEAAPAASANGTVPVDHTSVAKPSRRSDDDAIAPVFVANDFQAFSISDRQRQPRATYRKAASPLLCSFLLHAVLLSACLTFTIATIAQQDVPLLSLPAELDETSVEEFSTVEIPRTEFQDPELQNVAYESPDYNLSDHQPSELEPVHFGAGTQSLGEVGQLDALPSELGSLMAGAGSPGSGAPGGPAGEAIFFGARSKGDRFVFVVDNSSSMKGGRLDAAIAELLATVGGLTPKQSFYVIFVSDQTYPMFFPAAAPDMVLATPENKKRLAQWLPKAILASGNNRQLIKAMDMAAALRPHAVFLLWDGDMKYSDKVRLDVMTHLTRPNQWSLALLA